MRKNIKKTSLNQAVWRAEVRKKNNIKPAWRWLDNEEIRDIVEMRFLQYATYKEIAEKHKISIEAVRKHCIATGLPYPPKKIKVKTYLDLGFADMNWKKRKFNY